MSLSDLDRKRRRKLDQLWSYVVNEIADPDSVKGKISYIEGKEGGGGITFDVLGERWSLSLHPEME